MCFAVEGGLRLENDFLLRVRHFVSDEVRYPVLRVLLTPLMFFQRHTVIPRAYLDFGENVEVGEEFHLQLEVDFDAAVLSNCFMNVSSILKAQNIQVEGEARESAEATIKVEPPADEHADHLFSIGDEEPEEKEIEKKAQIEKMMARGPGETRKDEGRPPPAADEDFIDASDDDDDEEYLKNLEKRV